MSDESRPSDGMWPGLLVKARRDSWLAKHVHIYRNDLFEWPTAGGTPPGVKMTKGEPLIIVSLLRDMRFGKNLMGSKEDIVYVLTPVTVGWNIAWESMFENAYV